MTKLSTVSTSTKKPSAAARMEALRLPALRMADRLIGVAQTDKARRSATTQAMTRADKRRARLNSRTPVTARDANVETIAQLMDDPFEPGGKVEVQVNRRTDILKEERSHGRISEAAFLTGREVQAVFERSMLGLGGSNWSGGDRVDVELAKDKAIVRNIETARAIKVEMTRLKAAVGEIGARFLREILAEGVSFADYAARRGWSGERKVTYVAVRFRGSLEDLAEFRAAEGKAPPAPADKHSDAWRRAMAARQD